MKYKCSHNGCSFTASGPRSMGVHFNTYPSHLTRAQEGQRLRRARAKENAVKAQGTGWKFCPECGAAAVSGANFCVSCGRRMSG